MAARRVRVRASRSMPKLKRHKHATGGAVRRTARDGGGNARSSQPLAARAPGRRAGRGGRAGRGLRLGQGHPTHACLGSRRGRKAASGADQAWVAEARRPAGARAACPSARRTSPRCRGSPARRRGACPAWRRRARGCGPRPRAPTARAGQEQQGDEQAAHEDRRHQPALARAAAHELAAQHVGARHLAGPGQQQTNSSTGTASGMPTTAVTSTHEARSPAAGTAPR